MFSMAFQVAREMRSNLLALSAQEVLPIGFGDENVVNSPNGGMYPLF